MDNFAKLIGIAVIACVFVVGAMLLALPAGLWAAWWLYPAWHWFLVPIGLPSITFWQFFALIIVYRVFKAKYEATPEKTKEKAKSDLISMITFIILSPVFGWCMLWLTHKLVG